MKSILVFVFCIALFFCITPILLNILWCWGNGLSFRRGIDIFGDEYWYGVDDYGNCYKIGEDMKPKFIGRENMNEADGREQ